MMAAADNATAAPSLRQRLGRAGARLRPGVGGFWSWWTHALASWLPASTRTLFGLAHERMLLQRSGDSVHLSLERGDDVRDVGQVPWVAEGAEDPLSSLLAPRVADLPRWLLLPASTGLRRRMTLPAAAVDRLRDVVGFEIDRQTPFTAADVSYDTRLLARNGDQLDVELVVVPRTALDRAVAGIEAYAHTLAGIDVAGDDGRALGVNLLADAQRGRRANPWRRWNWALAAVAVLALAAGMWQVLANRRAVADAFAQEAQSRADAARAVSSDRTRLVNLVEGMQFLQQTRAGRPTMVEVMDELSRLLPDSTYLEKLSIEDDRMLVIGQSSEASALVGKLEGSRLWRSPALTGALQPDPRSGRDRFTLTAELVVGTVPANVQADAAKTGGADAAGQR